MTFLKDVPLAQLKPYQVFIYIDIATTILLMSNQRLSDFPSRAIPLLAYAAGDAFGVFYEFLDVPEKNIPQELKLSLIHI